MTTPPKALRSPPAFQVYASDDLASERYFGLALAQRGLLDAMRRACWVSDDGSIPTDPGALAIVVRCSEAEVRHALTSEVLSWFTAGPVGRRLIEPELIRQKAGCMARRQAQSNAAEATNKKRWASNATNPPITESLSESPGVSPLNRSEKTRTDLQEGANVPPTQEYSWTAEYNAAEHKFEADLRKRYQ